MGNHSNRPHRAIRKNGIVLFCSMSLTFAILRVYLHFSPDTDLNIGRYNVHHIFTGLLLIVAGGIPLAILDASTRRLEPARAAALSASRADHEIPDAKAVEVGRRHWRARPACAGVDPRPGHRPGAGAGGDDGTEMTERTG